MAWVGLVNLGNSYTYVNNNPINSFDPGGMAEEETYTITDCADLNAHKEMGPSGETCVCNTGFEDRFGMCTEDGDGTGGPGGPGPGGPGPGGGGSGGGPPPDPTPPEPTPPTDQQRECGLCEETFTDAKQACSRQAKWKFVGAVGTGILGGCLTGGKFGSPGGPPGALGGCLWGGAVGGIFGVLGAGLVEKISEMNCIDNAELADNYCRRKNRCSEIGRAG